MHIVFDNLRLFSEKTSKAAIGGNSPNTEEVIKVNPHILTLIPAFMFDSFLLVKFKHEWSNTPDALHPLFKFKFDQSKVVVNRNRRKRGKIMLVKQVSLKVIIPSTVFEPFLELQAKMHNTLDI